jgi:hypothetical protein
MGENKRKRLQRTSGIRKYNLIVSSLVKDKKRKKESYSISDIRKLASSIYPNFKGETYSSLKKTKGRILKASPIEKIAKEADEIPEIPERLLDIDQNYFFDTYKLLDAISRETSNQIEFTTDISGLEDFSIKGGDDLEPTPSIFYQNTFGNIVNYFNKLVSNKQLDYTDIRIVCSKPKKINGKWKSKIQILDSDGNKPGSANFNPELLIALEKYNNKETYTKPPETKKKPTKKELSEQAQQEIDAQKFIAQQQKEERIEIEKQKTIQIALGLVEKGKMSWEQFDTLMKTLYP